MACDELKGGILYGCQEWRFQSAKRIDMSTAIPQEVGFPDVQELRNQFAKHSDMGSDDMKGLRFADCQKSRF